MAPFRGARTLGRVVWEWRGGGSGWGCCSVAWFLYRSGQGLGGVVAVWFDCVFLGSLWFIQGLLSWGCSDRCRWGAYS